MSYPLEVALRYMGSRKRAFISISTVFAILGVSLGVAALATVMSVTGGFQAEFRDKVLGVNAHVLVLKYSTDFREYRSIMEQVEKVPGVVGVAPFSINPMMLTHGDATATGVLLKGVEPSTSLGVGAGPNGPVAVLDLPRYILPGGDLSALRLPGAKPPERAAPALPPVPTLDEAPPGGAPPIPLPGTTAPDAPGKSGRLANPLLDPTDEHGRDLGLLHAMEQRIREDERKAAAAPSQPDEAPAAEAAEDDEAAEERFAAGPVGNVEPEGGYKSVLPEDDAIPAEVDPDLCANPESVAKMPGIVIGSSLAKNLDLDIGKCVMVTSPTIGFSFTADGAIKPAIAKHFRVIAIFEAGFDQYDSKLVYTDLYEAQAFYGQGDTVTGVEMRVDDIDAAPAIAKEVARTLGSGLYHTMDWEELNRGLFAALRIQQIGMSAVLALIIVVAAFTVVATLIMVVLDKKKEIAVLKAMGATNSAILRIFVYQGGIIGFAGTTFGLLLGFAVCKGLLVYGFPLDPKVYFISHLPVQVRWTEFLITGGTAIAICLLATIIPSTYAARLSPAEGFRDR
ncbi:ABC transporter permease [Chondromyces crocatus]|uniref:ABC transporter permease n=1 Tax=Chondromyces crocatus TaxID=52 RepID=A0A0K1EBH9_CHOCO|nr:ABC transporter permease [Chondromyces crocatus]AKT38037.1 ABC transporter permease [Chondromyces crocatus]